MSRTRVFFPKALKAWKTDKVIILKKTFKSKSWQLTKRLSNLWKLIVLNFLSWRGKLSNSNTSLLMKPSPQVKCEFVVTVSRNQWNSSTPLDLSFEWWIFVWKFKITSRVQDLHSCNAPKCEMVVARFWHFVLLVLLHIS